MEEAAAWNQWPSSHHHDRTGSVPEHKLFVLRSRKHAGSGSIQHYNFRSLVHCVSENPIWIPACCQAFHRQVHSFHKFRDVRVCTWFNMIWRWRDWRIITDVRLATWFKILWSSCRCHTFCKLIALSRSPSSASILSLLHDKVVPCPAL